MQQMLPLLARTDIQWVVFQRGVQRNVWLAHEASEAAWNVDPAISWDDTASIVAGLDAVVTIDTALAHLSAGLGQHTFMLLSTAFDWRWESLPRTTLWYSSMRLVRQPSLGDWAGAVADLQAALSDWIRTGRMAQRGEEGVS
jgi:ADP-heptose:LPS heptosyltransferase